MFEFESNWLNDLQVSLALHEEFARSLLEFAMSITSKSPTNEFEELIHHLSLSQFAKSSKLYRAIVELCLIGRSDEATILNRSLLESTFKSEFLLADRMEFDGKDVSRECRAEWMVAQAVFQFESWVKKLEKTSGLESAAIQKRIEYESKFFPIISKLSRISQNRMEKIQKSAGTKFCCLSLSELADKLGMSHVYAGLYPHYSVIGHANDFDRMAFIDDMGNFSLRWMNPLEDIIGAIEISSRFFVGSIGSMDRLFGYGLEREIDLLIKRLESLETHCAKTPELNGMTNPSIRRIQKDRNN